MVSFFCLVSVLLTHFDFVRYILCYSKHFLNIKFFNYLWLLCVISENDQNTRRGYCKTQVQQHCHTSALHLFPAQRGHNKSQQKEQQGACAACDGNVLEVRQIRSFSLKRNICWELKNHRLYFAGSNFVSQGFPWLVTRVTHFLAGKLRHSRKQSLSGCRKDQKSSHKLVHNNILTTYINRKLEQLVKRMSFSSKWGWKIAKFTKHHDVLTGSLFNKTAKIVKWSHWHVVKRAFDSFSTRTQPLVFHVRCDSPISQNTHFPTESPLCH